MMTNISGPEGSFSGFFAPATAGARAPGIVLLHEIYGVSAFMRHACRLFADAGFCALSPDMFWRQEPGLSLSDGVQTDLDKAFALFAAFDVNKGIFDVQASIDHLRRQPECTGSVGVVGYCLGGLLSYLAMCRTDALAGVGYYGVDIDKHLDEAMRIRGQLMLHIADSDTTVEPEAIANYVAGLTDHPHVTLHRYPGMDHAFARYGTKYFKYDETMANLANARSIAFLKANLS